MSVQNKVTDYFECVCNVNCESPLNTGGHFYVPLWCPFLPGSTVITCNLYKVPMALFSSQGSCPQTNRPLQSPGHISAVGGYRSRKGLDPQVPSVGVPPGVARFSRPVGGHTVWDPKGWYGAARRHQVYPDSVLVGERSTTEQSCPKAQTEGDKLQTGYASDYKPKKFRTENKALGGHTECYWNTHSPWQVLHPGTPSATAGKILSYVCWWIFGFIS